MSSLQRRYIIYFSAPSMISLAVFYYLLFGRRITSPFFCSLSNTLEQLHSSGKHVSTFISFLYSNGLRLITNFLWMTLLLYLYYYYYPIKDTMIIFSIMAACIQQLIAFCFVQLITGVQDIYENSQPS